MGKNSAAMGYATYMNEQLSGICITDEQEKSVLFMNCFMVHLIQLILIACLWKFAIETDTFIITPAKSMDLLVAKFMGSLMMHINIERDVRRGISMMKLCVNHYKQFTNVYASFLIVFLWTTISIIIEFNVLVIMSTMHDIIDVIMKFVSLAAISKIPRFYFNAISDHKMLEIKNVQIKKSKFRN